MLGGMPAALAEMAVYSRPGIIEFLPAMPDFLAKGKLCGASLYTFMLLQTMEWDLEAGVLQAVLVSHENQICRVGSHKPAVIFRDGNPLTEQETTEGHSVYSGHSRKYLAAMEIATAINFTTILKNPLKQANPASKPKVTSFGLSSYSASRSFRQILIYLWAIAAYSLTLQRGSL